MAMVAAEVADGGGGDGDVGGGDWWWSDVDGGGGDSGVCGTGGGAHPVSLPLSRMSATPFKSNRCIRASFRRPRKAADLFKESYSWKAIDPIPGEPFAISALMPSAESAV